MVRPVFVIVTAAGAGTRLGSVGPKALVSLHDRPLLAHALDMLDGLDRLAGVAVTAPATHLDPFRTWTEAAHLGVPVCVCAGGATRHDSVAAGLRALATQDPIALTEHAVVLIHDAARCLAPLSLAQRVVAALEGGAAAVTPALPVVDTIMQVGGPLPDIPGAEQAGATLDRSCLRAVQTPQGFRGDIVRRAHEATDAADATDDFQLAAALTTDSVVIPGDPSAFKVTVPLDLERARQHVSTH